MLGILVWEAWYCSRICLEESWCAVAPTAFPRFLMEMEVCRHPWHVVPLWASGTAPPCSSSLVLLPPLLPSPPLLPTSFHFPLLFILSSCLPASPSSLLSGLPWSPLPLLSTTLSLLIILCLNLFRKPETFSRNSSPVGRSWPFSQEVSRDQGEQRPLQVVTTQMAMGTEKLCGPHNYTDFATSAVSSVPVLHALLGTTSRLIFHAQPRETCVNMKNVLLSVFWGLSEPRDLTCLARHYLVSLMVSAR